MKTKNDKTQMTFLEGNRKLKFSIALVVLATVLFAGPETTTAFVNWHAMTAASLLDPPGIPILLEWHLLNAATYGALVGSIIMGYLASNVSQKVFAPQTISPPLNRTDIDP